MHSLAALITTLLLASISTLALKLPEGFKIIEVVPFDRALMYDEAKGNPNVPLIFAKMTCERHYNVVLDEYTIVGHHWHGVTEEQLKETAKEGGLMTKWKFESWGEGEGNVECDQKTKLRFAAANQTCTSKSAGWRAKFIKPSVLGRPGVMLKAFERLTGMYGKDYARTEFLMSNGTALISSFTWEDYPEENDYFVC